MRDVHHELSVRLRSEHAGSVDSRQVVSTGLYLWVLRETFEWKMCRSAEQVAQYVVGERL